MENQDLISMSAVRSAMKVIYTPGLNLESPIGLRNDPHTATILHFGSGFKTDFEGAVAQIPPFERREFDAWNDSEDGAAFRKWSKRAFAMAAALDIVEQAWEQDGTDEIEEDEVDPKLQRLVDINWQLETHGVWFIIIAFIVAFVAFFGTGGMTGGAAATVRLVAVVIVAVLLLLRIGAKFLPSVIRTMAKRQGVEVPTREVVEDVVQPLWTEESEVTSAKILNYANWVLLAQPGAEGLMKLDAPDPVEPTEDHTERQKKILEAAKRWRDDSPLRPRKS